MEQAEAARLAQVEALIFEAIMPYHVCMNIIRISLILLLIFSCSSCQSTSNQCRELLPVRVLESEPRYRGEVTTHSADAAIRYIAMRDVLIGDDSPDNYDVQHDNWDRFVVTRYDNDIDSTTTYTAYLQDRQWLFELADTSSMLPSFGDFGLPFAIYEGREPEGDPRRYLLKTMRTITLVLAHDAQRHWINGDHALAIHRLHTILRISHQMQLKEDYADLDGLVAMAIAGVGLDRMDRMVQSEQANSESRELMLEAVRTLDGNDPLGVYCERTRTIRSMQAWLETQLDDDEGSIDLWAFIARFLGVQEIVSQLFRDVVTISLMSGEELETEIDEDQVLQQLLDELDGLDIEMVRDRYREYKPLVQIALDELRSESPDPGVLKELREATANDQTAVSDILGISLLDVFNRRYVEVLNSRDTIQKMLEAE